MIMNYSSDNNLKDVKSVVLFAIDNFEIQHKYFLYMMNSLKKYFHKIILIGNNSIMQYRLTWKKGVNFSCTDEKYDVEKWRNYIINHWSELSKYDEVYLMNSSMFGPIYDLHEMIYEMRNRKNDFWGITKHNSIFIDDIQICDAFLQRYFLCFRKSVLNEDLYSFFKEMPHITSFKDAEDYFEFRITEYLEKKKYKSDVYCQTDFLNGKDKKYSLSHLLANLDILLLELKMPFIPKVIFQIERKYELEYREGNQNVRVLKFIKEHSSYDINLILDYLIRTNNVYDNLINLNLFFNISNYEKTIHSPNKNYSTLVVCYLYYEDQIESRLEYLMRISSVADILIVTDDIKKENIINEKANFKKRVILTKKKGRDWAGLLVASRKYIRRYKYLCFIHDKKSDYLAYTSIGKSFQDLLWENMISSKSYIENILRFFDENPKIGLLLPPIYHMGIYNSLYADYWSICFDETISLANKIGINTNLISSKKQPISIGSCFWCRTSALRPLWNYSFSFDDFPDEPMPKDGTISHALERIIPYIAQNEGFLSAIVMSDEYGRLYQSNSQYMLQHLLKIFHKKKDYLGTFQQMITWLENIE